jgi:hypothetical protein
MVTLKFHDVNWKINNIEMHTQAIGDIDDDDYTGKLEVLCIKINHGTEGYYEFVNLDKATAIKFSKELRKQIALLD